MTLTDKPVRDDSVLFFPSGEGLCLHHLDLGGYYLINQVGAYIWNRCDGVVSVSEIAEEIAETFEVDDARARDDTLEFLSTLQDASCMFTMP